MNDLLFARLGNRVMSGPFKGMEIRQDVVWDDGNVGAKLIGCYEHELHQSIEKAISRRPVKVINLGCAEGYYAVGLCIRMPWARLMAFDVSMPSQQMCRKRAELNNIWASQLIIGGHCQFSWGELLIMDCEGLELEYLSDATCKTLTHCDVIVECHDFMQSEISTTLFKRFENTHIVEVIKPDPMPPGPYKFLEFLDNEQQRMAVTERRPQPTVWLAAWSKEL